MPEEEVRGSSDSIYLKEELFDDRFEGVCALVLHSFDRVLQKHFWFHLLFILGISVGALILLVISTLFPNSLLFVSFLSMELITIFSYFVLRIYAQVRLPEVLMELFEQFIGSAQQLIEYQEGIPSHHLTLAEMATRLSMDMKDREYDYLSDLIFYQYGASFFQKVSAWSFWKEVYLFRERLLKASVDEYLQIVQYEPLDIEVHASLANAYVLLSSLYSDPRKDIDVLEGKRELKWIPPKRFNKERMKTFREVASVAIEEFKIIKEMAPKDPWVHAQLAFSYHDLQMADEEIKAYQILVRLCPEDHESHFRLGILYFQRGENAKGLRIYEKLKKKAYPRAKDLLQFYGT